MSDLFGIRHAFREASENILIAATHEGVTRERRLDQARDDIARGFCPEAPFDEGEEFLIKAIEKTLSAMIPRTDLNANTYATVIVNELFKHLKPEDV